MKVGWVLSTLSKQATERYINMFKHKIASDPISIDSPMPNIR